MKYIDMSLLQSLMLSGPVICNKLIMYDKLNLQIIQSKYLTTFLDHISYRSNIIQVVIDPRIYLNWIDIYTNKIHIYNYKANQDYFTANNINTTTPSLDS